MLLLFGSLKPVAHWLCSPRLWVPESTGKCGGSSKAPIPWFHLHSNSCHFASAAREIHWAVNGTRPMKTPWKGIMWWRHSSHSNGSLVPNTAGDGLQRIQSFSFLTSPGGSWGCQSQGLYTLPTLDWMAHSPFLTGLQRNHSPSPDNAVIATAHPFCHLAKFRSTGHREKKKVILLDHLKLGDTVASFFLLLTGQNWNQTNVKLRPLGRKQT